jgi:cobalt-zinc-cadmium efflux system outer membrane protein
MSRISIVLCQAFLLLAPIRARAAPSDLDALLAEALRNNPEVLAARKRYEAARQRPSQASSLPDLMFSPGYTANGAPWPGAGLGVEPTSNIGWMVAQEFPFPGKRQLRGEIAAKEAEAEFQQYQQVQLSVVSRLKQAYYRRAWAFAAAGVLERNLALLRQLLQITEARYAVGRAQQQDILKAQVQISILETRKVQIDREKRAREAELASLAARPPESTLPDPAPPAPLALKASLEELYAAAQRNSPVLRAAEKRIQRAELAVNLARKDFYPDYTLRAGYFNMGRMPDMYQFSVDFKIPLYFFRKQRPAVEEQVHSLVGTRKEYESDSRLLHFRIKDDYLMAQTSAQLVDLYAKAVIPQASLALESSLASYQTGAVDFLTVFTNYITVVEYEMNYYEELQNLYLALSRLEEMTAMPLIDPATR